MTVIEHAQRYREAALSSLVRGHVMTGKALRPHVVRRVSVDVQREHPDFDMEVWKRVVAGGER